MKEKMMHDGKMMLCREMEEIIGKGKLTAGDLETLHKLSDTHKNLLKIEMLEEEEDGYSERGRKRDSMGRYSRDDGMDYSRAGDWRAQGRFGHGYEMGNSYESRGMYSREDGKDHMMHELGRLMDGANEHERRALERAMQEIRKA
jgi:hypothetical protein